MTDLDDPGVVVLAATDGSDHSIEALRVGLRTVRPAARLLIVTVVSPPDMSLVTGTGFAGGVMSYEEKEQMLAEEQADGTEILSKTVEALGAVDAETELLEGDPAHEICRAAVDRGASVIVMGTRGRGGVARFVLGSVSDHVVRNAACPVLTVG